MLIDLDAERLELIRTLAERMAKARGLDLTITATTDRRAGARRRRRRALELPARRLRGARAGRADPARHGVIGQETQGPGGFFMALRAINVMQRRRRGPGASVAPNAKVFNYTNPVNIVAQAWTHHSTIPIVSLCEGPIDFRERDRRRRPGSTARSSTSTWSA